MNPPTVPLRTTLGILTSPPYTNSPSSLKRSEQADIIARQFQPVEGRKDYADPEENVPHNTDRVMEKKLSKAMALSNKTRELCEKARESGEKVFRQGFGKEIIIEVFFHLDLDNLPPKQDHSSSDHSTNPPIEATDSFTIIELPPGTIYVALDCNLRRIFVNFNKGLETVYGATIGQWVLDSTTWNIDEYSQIHPPKLPNASNDWEEWLLSNPHLCWAPWSRVGVYHWGCWTERLQTRASTSPCLTQDTAALPAYIKPLHYDLCKSLGNMTRAQRLLLGAVDKMSRDASEKMVAEYPEGTKVQWITDERECFALRTCLVNAPPYYGGGEGLQDGAGNEGWAVMAPMGEFRGGDLCVMELGRRLVFQPGAVAVVRAGLGYYVGEWEGVRYCLECRQSVMMPGWDEEAEESE